MQHNISMKNLFASKSPDTIGAAGEIQMLWHGTAALSVSSIIEEGFDSQINSLVPHKRHCGHGMYFQ